MSAVYEALTSLSAVHDAELIDGYQRYDTLLATLLTPQQIETYAAAIRQAGAIRIFEELTPAEVAALSPEESVIATTIIGNENSSMENRRVAALLHQRGEDSVAPDMVPTENAANQDQGV